ncbi:DUF6221 family protein [Streptomyces sp. NBC_01363]|uniref:DUF6221 family protein n=1 Tax=Streptomyces sp. NBC_01363 TaxID=2903840 RepID=UPI002251F4AC|nr:DUF6221 family protein [Streptomyces sp. NBC_01363]MCX4733517.1 DUF6221 family protein [Streptomyces sp. NBC_01363]
MTEHLVTFLRTRLDEEADLARRCDGDGCCGEWSAHGNTVDFCQVELSDFHPTIALHVALHDPARVLLEVEAKRRILARHVLSPAGGAPELPRVRGGLAVRGPAAQRTRKTGPRGVNGSPAPSGIR